MAKRTVSIRRIKARRIICLYLKECGVHPKPSALSNKQIVELSAEALGIGKRLPTDLNSALNMCHDHARQYFKSADIVKPAPNAPSPSGLFPKGVLPKSAPFVPKVVSKPPMPRAEFYASDEWRALRYEALKLFGARCALCNADRSTGIRLHVDHIKPRSLYPALELVLSNLQVLCEDCNLGKSNRDEIDWRKGAA